MSFAEVSFYQKLPETFSRSGQSLWAQLGLENQEAQTILRSAGKEAIVMNRCLK